MPAQRSTRHVAADLGKSSLMCWRDKERSKASVVPAWGCCRRPRGRSRGGRWRR
jgi:hypothetical protein